MDANMKKFSDIPEGWTVAVGSQTLSRWTENGWVQEPVRRLWTKIHNGLLINIRLEEHDAESCMEFSSFDDPRPNGANRNERQHGMPVYTESTVRTWLTGQFMDENIPIGIIDKLLPIEMEINTPEGYLRRFGRQLRWQDKITLPTVEMINDYANVVTYNVPRYATWMTCEGAQDGKYMVVPLRSGSARLALPRQPNLGAEVHSVIRPDPEMLFQVAEVHGALIAVYPEDEYVPSDEEVAQILRFPA